MVHAHASAPHYAAHLLPVWDALPDTLRGVAYGTRPGVLDGPARPTPRGLTVVASATDARRVARHDRYVYVEHGAGQGYQVRSASYAGGAGHDRCSLFVAPNELVAARWRAVYPSTPVAVVGSPFLDRWHATIRAPTDGDDERRANGRHPDARIRVAAFAFHWECTLVPETRSALAHYRWHLPAIVAALRAADVHVLGHGHPRAWRHLRPMWEQLGVEPVPLFADVLDRAGVLVADNTSTLYEFASLDRPVVVLDAPWYRRDVHHGLRFWNLVPGPRVDGPADVAAAVVDAFDRDPGRAERRAVVDAVFPVRDGQAAVRAASAIVEVAAG